VLRHLHHTAIFSRFQAIGPNALIRLYQTVVRGCQQIGLLPLTFDENDHKFLQALPAGICEALLDRD
jgi:hypothetical protein